jgi:hypothetical protein
MFLFADETLNEFDTKGTSFGDIITGIQNAFKKSLKFETAIDSLTAMDDEAKKLQRTLGSGVINISNTEKSASQLRNTITNIYNESVKFGGSLENVTEYTGELSGEMGKMTLPVEEATINMIALSKTTGIGAKEVGKMTGQFLKLTLSQTQSASQMAKIAKMARETGIEAKKLLEEVQKNLSMVDAYNFQNGVDGLTKMSAQAQRLGTTIDKIVPKKFLEDMLDPEKAIEVAANFSMLGGSIEGLNNPFQLLNDGANNVGNLQNKIVDMAKSAFKINDVTGAIETNNVAMMRLREQANAVGGDYEELVKVGRVAAKEQLVQNKLMKEGVDLSKFSEEQMNLVKSLSEVGKGGKLELRIPGFETSDLTSVLSKNPQALSQALENYQKKAEMSDRQLAEQGLTLQEEQQKDTRIIRDAMLKQLSVTERKTLIESQYGGQKTMATVATPTTAMLQPGLAAIRGINAAFTTAKSEFVASEPTVTDIENANTNAKTSGTIGTLNDAFIGDGSKVISTGKGQMFNFIDEDKGVFAPDLDKKLSVLKESYLKVKSLESSTPTEISFKNNEPKTLPTQTITSKQETSQNISQTIDNNFNITVDLNIKGIPNSPLSDLLSRDGEFKRQLTEKIMDVFDKKDLLSKSKTRLQTR